MTPFKYLIVTVLVTDLFTALFACVSHRNPRPQVLWNASASVPVGLYRLRSDEHPALGDLVAIKPPPMLGRFMATRHYLARGLPLLKHVAALPGQQVCRWGTAITIDGRRAGVALQRDRQRRALPTWQGCQRIAPGNLFLLNRPSDSFDSRYFESLPAAGLLGRAAPILTRVAPGKPLVWHGLGAFATAMSALREPKP